MRLGQLLLAENDASLARALSRRLEHGGWSVHVVDDGQSALEAIQNRPPDVLLLDLRLPGLDGLDVLKVLQDRPETPAVVLMSGHLDSRTTEAAIRFGAIEVLSKPVEPAHLCEVLSEFAAHRRSPLPANDVEELVGASSEMRSLRERVRAVAPFDDLPVLIVGETGTGKELVARALHRLASREGPLVAVNCAAMPDALFESELFGHTSGSFTGATGKRPGLLEAAGSGTLFLDEVGELPASMQAKLLRVLETRRFRPVGSNHESQLRARVVSATNRDLRGEEGEALRADLFYRLAGYTLRTPPLRDRMDDVDALTRHFLATFSKRYDCGEVSISPEALCALQTHRWPGNVRELRAVLQSAMVHASGRIGVRHVIRALGRRGATDPMKESGLDPRLGLPEVERAMVLRAHEESGGNLSLAARKLQIPRSTLRDKLRRYGIVA